MTRPLLVAPPLNSILTLIRPRPPDPNPPHRSTAEMPPTDRTWAFSLLSGCQAAGWVIGPAMGAAVAHSLHVPAPSWLAGLSGHGAVGGGEGGWVWVKVDETTNPALFSLCLSLVNIALLFAFLRGPKSPSRRKSKR